MKSLISVVIPTHNRSNLLIRAINSVLNQTYNNIEIIVVSDGSTDETKSVVEEFMEKDNRIRFIEYHPARGGNAARNMGIEAASGEYVAFLDDDDEWLPLKLQKQMDLIRLRPNIGLIYTGVNIIYVKENVSYSFIGSKVGDLKNEILLDNCIGTTSSVLLEKKLFDQVGLFDEKLPALQDFDLWIRICQLTSIGCVQEGLVNYFNYTGEIQVSSKIKRYEDAFLYINAKYQDLFSRLDNQNKKIKRKNEIVLLINKAMRNRLPRIARQYSIALLKEKSLKSLFFYVLSFFDYATVLKIKKRM